MTTFSRFSSVVVTIALAVGLLLTAGFGPAHAQTSDRADPGMLPDHPMYFMTSMSESIGTFFTFGEVNQAERSLELSERRLNEARALSAAGKPEEAEKAVGRYQAQLDRALSKAKQAQANGSDVDAVLSDVSGSTRRHQEVLAEVYQNVPQQARPGIERAMEASRRGGVEAGEARPDTPGRSGATGRPESAGPPSHSKGKGPPPSQGQAPDRPGANERPDSPEEDTDQPDRDRPDRERTDEERTDGERTDRDRPDSPGVDARPDRGERGPPDSVETGRPDTTSTR